jgi:hypothetical protein
MSEMRDYTVGYTMHGTWTVRAASAGEALGKFGQTDLGEKFDHLAHAAVDVRITKDVVVCTDETFLGTIPEGGAMYPTTHVFRAAGTGVAVYMRGHRTFLTEYQLQREAELNSAWHRAVLEMLRKSAADGSGARR